MALLYARLIRVKLSKLQTEARSLLTFIPIAPSPRS